MCPPVARRDFDWKWTEGGGSYSDDDEPQHTAGTGGTAYHNNTNLVSPSTRDRSRWGLTCTQRRALPLPYSCNVAGRTQRLWFSSLRLQARSTGVSREGAGAGGVFARHVRALGGRGSDLSG